MSKNQGMEGDFQFHKHLSLTFLFFIITPLVITVSLFSLFSIRQSRDNKRQVLGANWDLAHDFKAGVSVYAALPDNTPVVEADVHSDDARVEVLKLYLRHYYSPLEKYADTLVEEADKNSLDYRLLTAIAQQESNLCKVIPTNSYNCWGWGVHSQGTLRFDSYEHGIRMVSEGLKKKYINQGYTNVEDIMGKYTPLSQGSWASGVLKFMADIENFSY